MNRLLLGRRTQITVNARNPADRDEEILRKASGTVEKRPAVLQIEFDRSTPVARVRIARWWGVPEIVAEIAFREADTPEDPHCGADASWRVFGKSFKATPREQLETHSETSSETRTRPARRLFGHADK
jgi:hypothetical protein